MKIRLISPPNKNLKATEPQLLSTILFWVSFVASALACAMGTMTSISPTSISREGKGLQNILSLPFPISKLISAKMLHAMLYSVISSAPFTSSITIAECFSCPRYVPCIKI